MEATELRTKNLVLNDNCICEVIHIYGGSFTHCTLKTKQGNEINANYVLLKPIPLTEEILLKCGFKYVEYFNSFGTKEYGYKLGILTIRQSLEKTKYLYDYNNDLYVELKSLHQLQNLYFSLTGQELEINL